MQGDNPVEIPERLALLPPQIRGPDADPRVPIEIRRDNY